MTLNNRGLLKDCPIHWRAAKSIWLAAGRLESALSATGSVSVMQAFK